MRSNIRANEDYAKFDSWLFKWVTIMAFLGFACTTTAIGYGIWWVIKISICAVFASPDS